MTNIYMEIGMSIDLNKNDIQKLILSLLKPDPRKAKNAAELVNLIGVSRLHKFSKKDQKQEDDLLEKQAKRRILRILDDMIDKPIYGVEELPTTPRTFYLKTPIDYSSLLQMLYGLNSNIVMQLPAEQRSEIELLDSRQIPNSVEQWQQKIYVGRSGFCHRAEAAPETIRAIYKAVESEQFVEFDYQNLKGQKSTPEVFPWGILLKGDSCYLVANQFDRGKPLPITYALHRIKNPKITNRVTKDAPGKPQDKNHFQRFCKDRQLDIFASEFDEDIEVQLRFFNGIGLSLHETVLAVDQQIEPINSQEFRLKATVKNCFELHRFILGYGADVEVESPLGLRELIAEKLKVAATRY